MKKNNQLNLFSTTICKSCCSILIQIPKKTRWFFIQSLFSGKNLHNQPHTSENLTRHIYKKKELWKLKIFFEITVKTISESIQRSRPKSEKRRLVFLLLCASPHVRMCDFTFYRRLAFTSGWKTIFHPVPSCVHALWDHSWSFFACFLGVNRCWQASLPIIRGLFD